MNGLLRCAIISDSERGVLASSRLVTLSVTRLDTLLLPGLVNRLLTHCRLIYRASLHIALLVNLNFISSVPPFSSSVTSHTLSLCWTLAAQYWVSPRFLTIFGILPTGNLQILRHVLVSISNTWKPLSSSLKPNYFSIKCPALRCQTLSCVLYLQYKFLLSAHLSRAASALISLTGIAIPVPLLLSPSTQNYNTCTDIVILCA